MARVLLMLHRTKQLVRQSVTFAFSVVGPCALHLGVPGFLVPLGNQSIALAVSLREGVL